MAKSGKDGGCEAVEEVRGQKEDEHKVEGCYDVELKGEDNDDIVDIAKLVQFLKRAKNNRMVPEGRLVKEILDYIVVNSEMVGKEIVAIMNGLIRVGKIPKRWQISQTAQLDKNNGKTDTKAVRLINMLCPLGKAFFKIIWDEAECTKYDFAYGFYDGRRREQAILVQYVTTWKLRTATRNSGNNSKSDFNHITTLRDVANAFPSPRFGRMIK